MNGITNPALKPEIQQKDVLEVFINNLVTIGFSLAGLLALFVLITGAIQWITSGGDKAGLEAARGKMKYAIIGLIILALIFLFINLIGKFLGLDLLHPKFPILGEPSEDQIKQSIREAIPRYYGEVNTLSADCRQYL